MQMSKPTFQLNGTTFEEGDTLILSTPEIGTVEVTTTIRPLSGNDLLGLSLGFVTTPLPCRMSSRPDKNAFMELYTNGNYVKIGLFYHCSCQYDLHSHALEWFDLTIDGNRITANTLGSYFRQPHNHTVGAEYAHLIPEPSPFDRFVSQQPVEAKVIASKTTVEEKVSIPVTPIAPKPKPKPVEDCKPLLSKEEIKADRVGQLSMF